MKKFSLLLLLCAFFLVVCPSEGKAAAVQSKIILDGNEITMPDNVQVAVVNGNVMIPIRVVVENLKFNVDWNQKDKSVRIQQNSKVISLTVDKDEVTVDGKKVILKTAPQVKNNSVLVPIRFVSEQMGLTVSWDNTDKTVYLTSAEPGSADNGQANTDTDVKVDLPTLTVPNETIPSVTTPLVDPAEKTNSTVNRIEFVNNQLVVSLDHEVKPKIMTLSNPDRIVVDLPNTTFADTFAAIQPLDTTLQGALDTLEPSVYPNVTGVKYSLFTRDPNTVRIVIGLNAAQKFRLNQDFGSNFIAVDLNVSEDEVGYEEEAIVDSGHSGRKVVVIDPGHGGSDPGASSVTKKREKDFNLSVGLKVQAILLKEPNIDVVMTRESDVYPTLSERALLANQIKADVFVSIHGNSNTSSSPNGTETYYYKRSESKELATIIHKYVIKATGLKDRGVKNENFHVIRETTMAASLVEVGFLSNSIDEAVLFTDDLQNRVAQAIVDGIKEYLSKGTK
ncbi:N-acetylmuramoyl-L-alanine amidase [Paenibacillus sp. FA6]|uniref:N-acetylmuramoyl-L-alanine amidase n=1 Tax=Paenibacillus sp. FA6 TaxID=3413029 RepID=UPI003F65616F